MLAGKSGEPIESVSAHSEEGGDACCDEGSPSSLNHSPLQVCPLSVKNFLRRRISGLEG